MADASTEPLGMWSEETCGDWKVWYVGKAVGAASLVRWQGRVAGRSLLIMQAGPRLLRDRLIQESGFLGGSKEGARNVRCGILSGEREYGLGTGGGCCRSGSGRCVGST